MNDDKFNGDDAKLCSSIDALLALDTSGALVPHRIGGHARTLLSAAATRLRRTPAAPVPASTGREPDWSDSKTLPSELWKNPLFPMSERLEMADGAVRFRNDVIANLRAQLAAIKAQPSPASARELDVEAERPVFDDPIRLGEDPYKEMQPYFKKIRNAAPGLEYAIAVGELIAWMNDRINKAERAARSAAQSTAPVSTEQAGDAPAAHLYEWIGEEGSRKKGDLIARTQSELGGNIDLYPHCWKRVGALIQVAPSPNNSPVGGKDKESE